MSEPTKESCSEHLARKSLDVTLLVRIPDKNRKGSQAEEEGCPERLLSLRP